MRSEITSRSNNAGTARVQPAELQAFFSKQGPLEQLKNAQKALLKAVNDSFYEPLDKGMENALSRTVPRYGIKPIAATLSGGDSEQLLLGHVGLNGEFANGFEATTELTLHHADYDAVARLRGLRTKLAGQSELAKSPKSPILTNAHAIQTFAGIHQSRESKAEALKRCARLIGLYLEVNADIIPSQETDAIRAHLHTYTMALEQLLTFVEKSQVNSRARTMVT